VENQNSAADISEKVSTDPYNQRAPNLLNKLKKPRWQALDVARGIAIVLMILSHCVKGMLHGARIPDWGVVPVHLLTKFSSSLFILVFGVSLSLYFLPSVGKSDWAKKRRWMLKRGIELMIWYKVLTVVQLFQYYPRRMIIQTLMFERMPDFVEILGFYSFVLLWIPFFLPVWNRLHLFVKPALIVGVFFLGQWLHYNFDFWDIKALKAILVEEEKYYTFGQFQRGALVFLGLYIGDLYKLYKTKNEKWIPSLCIATGALSLGALYWRNQGGFSETLQAIAGNVGKHPFNIPFFLYSVGGSLLILGICLLMNRSIIRFLKPITYLGRHSLDAFILHIFIIFYFFRYYFDLHNKVTYHQSLGLTLACIFSIIGVLFLWEKIKKAFK